MIPPAHMNCPRLQYPSSRSWPNRTVGADTDSAHGQSPNQRGSLVAPLFAIRRFHRVFARPRRRCSMSMYFQQCHDCIRPILRVLAVLLAIIFGPSPPASYATFPGMNGEIAFTSGRDGNSEIYVMNAD